MREDKREQLPEVLKAKIKSCLKRKNAYEALLAED